MYTCMSDVATLSRFIATAMLMVFAGVVTAKLASDLNLWTDS